MALEHQLKVIRAPIKGYCYNSGQNSLAKRIESYSF